MGIIKDVLRGILSQEVINNFYHLPKAVLANIVYGFPTRELKVIEITGTDGKTTTVNMVYQILEAAGKKVSMVSTINTIVGGKTYDTGFHVTSPDPFVIQRLAKQARNGGDEYLVLEVTSHALDQYRFWGIKLDVGVITNITHEHLDYHKTFENYRNTKLRLLKDVKYAIVNNNLKTDVLGPEDNYGRKKITFGLEKGDFNQKENKLKLKIPGDYNVENALAALGVAFVLDIDRKVAVAALEKFEGLTGRMEDIKNNKGIRVVVDFAHTPNALEQALHSLRSQVRTGRLIAVMGAEGFRDAGKRAMMGEAAQRLADFVVVTAVDPRGQLKTINEQIIEGIRKAGGKKDENFFVIDNREEAINFAINKLSKKGDVIGIFGKGHETSMNLDGRKEIPWSDRKAVDEALKKDMGSKEN